MSFYLACQKSRKFQVFSDGYIGESHFLEIVLFEDLQQ